jgi:proline iminopeptidase
VLGMSWGSTLGLAYAEAHPERVAALVLALVTMTTRREVEWITQDMGRIFPREWDRFAAAVPEELRHLRLVDAYATLLFDADPAVRDFAAREWCAWEDAHVSLAPNHTPNPRYEDPEYRLRFSRLVTHYWRNHAFLDDGQLLREAPVLNGIPGALISGRYDVSGPLDTAWHLSHAWTTSRLEVIGDSGHGGGDAFLSAVIESLIELAQ